MNRKRVIRRRPRAHAGSTSSLLTKQTLSPSAKERSMASRPRIARTLSALHRALARWRDSGESIALVPTMGALHEGHLALVRLARRRPRRVVVSIFVNPAQFAPAEDFSTYPRTFAADVAALAEEKADTVWAPANIAVMYPEGS